MADAAQTALEFPLVWEDPADSELFWTRDVMHFPDPVPPLDFDVTVLTHQAGAAQLNTFLGLPVRPEARLINTFRYGSTQFMAPEAEVAVRARLADERTLVMAHRPAEIWRQMLPEIEHHLDHWRSFDRSAASAEELLAHLDDSVERLQRIWFLHFLTTRPALVAMDQFTQLYGELFPEASILEPLALLRGQENLTTRTGRELWRLSRLLDRPGFDEALRRFLDSYGHRADSLAITAPSWIEDPAPVLAQLRAFAANPQRDPVAELDRQRIEATEAAEEARRRLAGYPVRVRELFETWLRAAREATLVWEDHNFHIDHCCDDAVRQVLRELGRRACAAGGIACLEDLPMLHLSELRNAVRGTDLKDVVERRKEFYARFAGVVAPSALGCPPAGGGLKGVVVKAGVAFFGRPPPPPEGARLIGAPASAGRVAGTARVRHRLEDARGLQPGEILVVPSTTQSWTPLFAIAAAVVSDSGGVLCHCALMAREYGIPAVVGTQRGTQLIKDGDLIEVDGEAGTVLILGT